MSRAEDWLNTGMLACVILFIGGMGAGMAWDGLGRGARFARVDPSRTYTLVAEGKKPRPGRYSGESMAYGRIQETGERAEVAIFSTQYDVLAPGGHLEVYRLGPEERGYVFRKKYEESWPIIDLRLFAFSWHFPVGIAMIALAIRLGRELRRKPWRKPGDDRRVA